MQQFERAANTSRMQELLDSALHQQMASEALGVT